MSSRAKTAIPRKRPKTGNAAIRQLLYDDMEDSGVFSGEMKCLHSMVRPKTASDIQPYRKNIEDLKRARSAARNKRLPLQIVKQKQTTSYERGDLEIRLEAAVTPVNMDDDIIIQSNDKKTQSQKIQSFYQTILKDSSTYLEKLNSHCDLERINFKKIRIGSLLVTANFTSFKALAHIENDLKSGKLNSIMNEVFLEEELLTELGLDGIHLESQVLEEDLEKCRDGLMFADSPSVQHYTDDLYISRLDCARMMNDLHLRYLSDKLEMRNNYHAFCTNHLNDFFMVLKLTKSLEIKRFQTLNDVLLCKHYIEQSPSVGKSVKSELLTTYLDIVEKFKVKTGEIFTQIKKWEPDILKYLGRSDLALVKTAAASVFILLDPEVPFSENEAQQETEMELSVMDRGLFRELVTYVPALINAFNQVISQLKTIHDILAFDQSIGSTRQKVRSQNQNKLNPTKKEGTTDTKENQYYDSTDSNVVSEAAECDTVRNDKSHTSGALENFETLEKTDSITDSVDTVDITDFLEPIKDEVKPATIQHHHNSAQQSTNNNISSQIAKQNNHLVGKGSHEMPLTTEQQCDKNNSEVNMVFAQQNTSTICTQQNESTSEQHPLNSSNQEECQNTNKSDKMDDTCSTFTNKTPANNKCIQVNLNSKSESESEQEWPNRNAVLMQNNNYDLHESQNDENQQSMKVDEHLNNHTDNDAVDMSQIGQESNLFDNGNGYGACIDSNDITNTKDCSNHENQHPSHKKHDCRVCHISATKPPVYDPNHKSVNIKQFVFDSEKCIRGPYYHKSVLHRGRSSCAHKRNVNSGSHRVGGIRSKSMEFINGRNSKHVDLSVSAMSLSTSSYVHINEAQSFKTKVNTNHAAKINTKHFSDHTAKLDLALQTISVSAHTLKNGITTESDIKPKNECRWNPEHQIKLESDYRPKTAYSMLGIKSIGVETKAAYKLSKPVEHHLKPEFDYSMISNSKPNSEFPTHGIRHSDGELSPKLSGNLFNRSNDLNQYIIANKTQYSHRLNIAPDNTMQCSSNKQSSEIKQDSSLFRLNSSFRPKSVYKTDTGALELNYDCIYRPLTAYKRNNKHFKSEVYSSASPRPEILRVQLQGKLIFPTIQPKK